jgi:hypothetical protein
MMPPSLRNALLRIKNPMPVENPLQALLPISGRTNGKQKQKSDTHRDSL